MIRNIKIRVSDDRRIVISRQGEMNIEALIEGSKWVIAENGIPDSVLISWLQDAKWVIESLLEKFDFTEQTNTMS